MDTNALSAWLDGDPAIARELARADSLVLSPIVLGEFGFGIAGSRHKKAYETRLKELVNDFAVLSLDATTAVRYAVIRTELKKAGTPIPWHDLWIAAQARQHQLPVLSRDARFDAVRGLRRQGW